MESKNRFVYLYNKQIIIWAAIVVILASCIGYYTVSTLRKNKDYDLAEDYMRMSPDLTEPGLTPGDRALPPGADPIRVLTGIYVDRIEDINLKDSKWLASFYLWFQWRGKKVNPAANFQIINGEVLSKE
jgi:hypothetical protein